MEGATEEPPPTSVCHAPSDDEKAHALKRDGVRQLMRDEGTDLHVGCERGVLVPLVADPGVPCDAAPSRDHEMEDSPVGKARVRVVDGAADDGGRGTFDLYVGPRQDQQLGDFLASVKMKMERVQDKKISK